MNKFSIASPITAAALAIALLGIVAVPARAEKAYVSVFGSVNFPEADTFSYAEPGGYEIYRFDMETGYSFGAAAGLRLTDYARVEIEVSHFATEADHYFGLTSGSYPGYGPIDGTLGLANIWLDWPNDSPVTPYAGLGAGFGHVTADTELETPSFPGVRFDALTGSDTGFAFQLGAGARMELSENIVLDVGYRFKSIQNLEFAFPSSGRIAKDVDVNMHLFQASLSYAF